LTFYPAVAGSREGSFAGGFPPESSRSKRGVKKRRKRDKSEDRRFLSEFKARFDSLVEIALSQQLAEETAEQYSLRKEYYPVKIPRSSRCNPFKASALKAYEDFLAKRDIGVSYTRLPHKNNSSRITSAYAWEGLLLSHSWCENRDYVKVIKPFFEAYLDYTNSHVLVFKRNCEDDSLLSCVLPRRSENGSPYIIIPFRTRFHESYKRKVYAQLKKVFFPHGTHLILTTDLDSYPDIFSAVEELRRRASKVISFLRRELRYFYEYCACKRLKPPRRPLWKGLEECKCCRWIFDLERGFPPKELRYICVLEFSFKRGVGSPHLHILLDRIYLNKCGIALIRWGIMYPHSYLMKAVHFYGLKARSYVMKYAKKLLIVSTKSSESVLNSACLYWLTGRRLFSTSRDLLSSEEHQKKGYVFLGIYPKLLRGVYPIEENLHLLDDPEFLADVRIHDEWVWSSCIRKLKAG